MRKADALCAAFSGGTAMFHSHFASDQINTSFEHVWKTPIPILPSLDFPNVPITAAWEISLPKCMKKIVKLLP